MNETDDKKMKQGDTCKCIYREQSWFFWSVLKSLICLAVIFYILYIVNKIEFPFNRNYGVFLSFITYDNFKAFLSFFFGFLFSLCARECFVKKLVEKSRCWSRQWIIKKYNEPSINKDNFNYGVPPIITGYIEAGFFTLLVALSEEPTPIIGFMLVWIGIKMAAGWHRSGFIGEENNKADKVVILSNSLSGAIGGLTSMMFAYIGGLICRYPFNL